jgi:hypothetical protein
MAPSLTFRVTLLAGTFFTSAFGAYGQLVSLINWGTVGFNENVALAPVTNTYVPASNPLSNPYFGLESSTGGISNFVSQTFTNVSGTGISMTVSFSRNNYDGPNLQGLDLYTGGENPDHHVSGINALRINRDLIRTNAADPSYSPVTVVLSFSQDVYLREYIVASLSTVGVAHENAFVRAFATADATGPVVKANYLENISDRTNSTGLLIDPLTASGTSPNVNSLANLGVNPALALDSGGVSTTVGTVADTGLYHAVGLGAQEDKKYGRMLLSWDSTPIRSIAYSTWASTTEDYASITYSNNNVSTIFAPVAFSLEPVPEPSTFGMFGAAGLIGAVLARRRRLR